MNPSRRSKLLLAVLPVLLVAPACAHRTGPFVWVDDLAAEQLAAPSQYVIQPGDTLSVRVWGQEGMSGRPRVRDDGHISLPFLQDVQAAGLTPDALSAKLQTQLKSFLANPAVTISLEEKRPLTVSVVGEVTRPGSYTLDQNSGVLGAVAAAGGLTAWADEDRVFVVRSGMAQGRVRFRYDQLMRAEGAGARFTLKPGDVVVVE